DVVDLEEGSVGGVDADLARLQHHLFAVEGHSGAPLGEGAGAALEVLSAPGESREAIEIARRVRRESLRGVPFDRMAIVARAPVKPAGAPNADAPVVEGTLRAPVRWERLIVEASVIGGRDRWERRLEGYEHHLQKQKTSVLDDARMAALDRELAELASLRA